MTDDINYKSNPLHGVGLKAMLTELVDHYGFEILFAYLNINCFKTNANIVSSIKFLKKTDWAREKVENFYLTQFKNLPAPSYEQSQIPPRSRVIPDDQKAGEPAVLSLEEAAQLQEERVKKAAEYDRGRGKRRGSGKGAGAYEGRPVKRKPTVAPKTHSDKDDASGSAPFNPWTKSSKS